ncbi:MAG: sodium:proton antiporter [Kyrpidia sp.]|nr:sodium:proton antiporter [Kyrpidia sp.]
MGAEASELVHEGLRLLAVALAAGIVLGRAANQLRIPDIVLYLVGGMLLGPAGVGLIDVPAGSAVNQFILTFGASAILLDGGLATELNILRRVWITLMLLVTAGVLVTAVVVAGTVSALMAVPFLPALLVGSVLASTDPAALIPIFRRVPVKPQLAQTVISESAFNDAVGAILVSVVLGAMAGGGFSPEAALGGFVRLAGIGLVVGAAVGFAAAFLLGHRSRYFAKDYEAATAIAAMAGAYVSAESLGGSGFMAVFTAGLMIGNAGLFAIHYQRTGRERLCLFVEHLGLKMRMLIFLLLGSQVDLAQLFRFGWGASAVMAAFILIARPLAVLVSALPDRRAHWGANDVLFLMWTRETGVIPAALAGMIAGRGLTEAPLVSAITFLAIVTTLLIQATSTPWVAKKLRVLADPSSPSESS